MGVSGFRTTLQVGKRNLLAPGQTTKLKPDCPARGPESLTHSSPPCPSGETEAQREEGLVQGHTTSRCLFSPPLEQRVLWGRLILGAGHVAAGYSIVVVVLFLIRVRLFMTPWTVAHQAPLSMGFPRQEY